MTPQEVYDAYRKDPQQDMWEYSPMLRANARGNILEIGVRGGVSTAAFLLGLEKNGGHLFSIDIVEDCGKLFNHPQWTFVAADSQRPLDVKHRLQEHFGIKHFWDLRGQFDILMIDGDHRKKSVQSDLDHYATLVRSGGLIFVHDIIMLPECTPELVEKEKWANDDVRQVYEAFAKTNRMTRIDFPGKCGMGVLIA